MNHQTEPNNWHWKSGDVSHQDVIELLTEHMNFMAAHSPPESRHVLDVDALQQPGINFWSLWQGTILVGCVALKHWNDEMGEIKSMKTSSSYLRQGVGHKLLQHVVAVAEQRGYDYLKLETGSMAYFEPARKLYKRFGFKYCGPFGDYVEDPNNVFMSLAIG